MRVSLFFLSTLLALFALPAAADMGDSVTDEMIRLYSPEDTFHLFGQQDFKDFSYSSDRTLKFCDTSGKDAVGLKVKHDGMTSTVRPGACGKYTAKNFHISPAGSVSQDYDLVGTIEHAKG